MDDDELGAGLHRIMGDLVSKAREERRPRMEDVVRVIGKAFKRMLDSGELDVVPLLEGPETWSWGDKSMIEMGFDRVYCLTASTMPGAEGYPLMTIRQVIAPQFDAQLSVSTLIFGPDDEAIARSVAMLITNHAAAFQGLRESISMIASAGTGAAIDRVKRNKAENDGIDVSVVIPKKGELN